MRSHFTPDELCLRHGARACPSCLTYECADLHSRLAATAKERDALEAELLAVADAAGYVNRAEGRHGYERASGEKLAAVVREMQRDRDDWRDEAAHFAMLRMRIAQAFDCEPDDDADLVEAARLLKAERDATREALRGCVATLEVWTRVRTVDDLDAQTGSILAAAREVLGE